MGMPRKKVPCPQCGQLKKAESRLCGNCTTPYERTPERNRAMSDRTTGIRRPGWKSASTQPEIAAKIRQSWTAEHREAARLRGLAQAADPEWRLRCGRPGH